MGTLTAASPAEAVRSRSPAGPLVLYGLTGFSGLLAEQGFERYVSLLVGVTAAASAVVISTYFLGFAIGGFIAARLLRRCLIRRPLRVYALLELVIGASCVAFSFTFHPLAAWLAPLQNHFDSVLGKQLVRFACGCLLVLPIAALMGATFPLIAQALQNRDSPGRRRWTQAYSVNLAGAVLAALLAPYLILPLVGMRGALWICFAIGVCVFAIAARMPEPQPDVYSIPWSWERLDGKTVVLLAASFASGAVFFALEVIWTHLVGVVLGRGIYAFSSMLAMVLLGLLWGAVMVDRRTLDRSPIRPSSFFLFAGFLLLMQFRLWDLAPRFLAGNAPRLLRSFYGAELCKLYIAALLIVPSSVILGIIYPRLLSSPQIKSEGNSYLAGYLSASNSLGCLSGALLATFVLIPLLGSESSLKLIILIVIAFGLLFLLGERRSEGQVCRVVAFGAVLVCSTLYLRWDWLSLTAGTAVYFGSTRSAEGAKGASPESRARFGFAAIPSMFVSDFDDALLIGLGTGHSGATLRQLGYRHVDIAELAPGILAAAHRSFPHLNRGVLDAPNVKLFLEDGRNVLLTNPEKSYSLITIEISSVWFAGSTNLYCKEFYELARRRLRPGGVLQQWIQIHHIGPRELASALGTLRAAFPHVSFWFYGDQGMMLASEWPQVLEESRKRYLIERLLAGNEILPADARRTVEAMAGALLLDVRGVDRLCRSLRPIINTDHNRWIEYATPRYNASDHDWRQHNISFLSGLNHAE